MSGYQLADGRVLTDEEIERRASEWDRGTWAGHLRAVRVGRPRLSDEATANLSFKCPASGAELIARAAQATGVKKSAFIRAAALEKAARVLGPAE